MYEFTDDQREHWRTHIEIDITEKCNMSCSACSRCCDKFKSDKHLDVSVVRHFVEDSLSMDYVWHSIKILGGEPTLHPQLDEIIKVLYEYKKVFPNCKISILSNGVIKREYPSWLNDNYTLDHSFHRPFYISPTDIGKVGTNHLCLTLWQCGIGLGSYGFTPCVLGTAMCRVWGYIGIERLCDCNDDALLMQCKNLCKHCGAYLTDSSSWTTGEIFNYGVADMTPSWQKRWEEYLLSRREIY